MARRLPAEWEKLFQDKGALWFHDGNAARPHALLTSGKHSSGFCNCEIIMEDPMLLAEMCAHLIEQAAMLPGGFQAQRIVGPAMGAITLAHELARQIGVKRNYPCYRAYTEKNTDGSMSFKRTSLLNGEKILLVEDVLTTGKSVGLAMQAVNDAGGQIGACVFALVNRSGLVHVQQKPIVALITKALPVWEPDDCPLCQQGSEAIRPKGTENWERLNASY